MNGTLEIIVQKQRHKSCESPERKIRSPKASSPDDSTKTSDCPKKFVSTASKSRKKHKEELLDEQL